jgi:O-antigen/teichoic acid export membrane protein
VESENKAGNEQNRYDHLFVREHLKWQLKGRAVRGGLTTMIAEFVSFTLRMGSTIVLARILLPEQFGLIGMVTALLTIAERFKDLGLSTATVQRNQITHEEVSALFWINVGFGVVITLIAAASSGMIAWFYGDHRLVGITLALSVSFIFSGLTVQHQALLRRQMHFSRLAGIQILANLFSIVISIFLAWKGFAYWALVWKEVSRSLLVAVGTMAMCPWFPGKPTLNVALGGMLRFGRDIAAFNVLWFLSRSLDQILIGKFWGAGPLGLYRQAYQLLVVPISQLTLPLDYVAEPALSALQRDPEQYRQSYRRIISFLACVAMPLTVYLGVFSDTLVRLLLGEKWIEAAPIFQILAIGAFIQPLTSTCGFVMVTNGKSQQYLRWGLLNAVSVSIAFTLGLPWGPLGVAKAYTINAYLIFGPSLWYGLKGTPISLALFFRTISLYSFASVLMGLFILLMSPKITSFALLSQVFISLPIAITVYFGTLILIPEGRRSLMEHVAYLLESVNIVPRSVKNNL